MKKILFISVILLATIFTNCKSSKKSTISTNSDVKTEVIPELIVDKECKADSIDYAIYNVALNGNVLSMDVNYKGGCGTHKFDLMFNGNYAKSLPVQASIFLKHSKENETCDKEVTESLKFDISTIQYPKNSTVIIKVASIKEKFEYTY